MLFLFVELEIIIFIIGDKSSERKKIAVGIFIS